MYCTQNGPFALLDNTVCMVVFVIIPVFFFDHIINDNHIGHLGKNGGQKIDLNSLLLNKFS